MFETFKRQHQLELLSEILRMLSRMREIEARYRDHRTVGQFVLPLHEVQNFEAIAWESIRCLRDGASTLIFRGNILKAFRRVYLALMAAEGAITGHAAFKERYGSVDD